MKKLLLVMVAMLLVTGSAFAFPVIDWSSPAIFATDPSEVGIGANYNISALRGVFTGGGLSGDLALRTDVFGTATLIPEDPGQQTATYQWNIDLDGNGTPNIFTELRREYDAGTSTFISRFYINGTEFASNWMNGGNNMQVLIPSSYLGVIDPTNFGVYAYLEGGSTALDDRLPDSGWSHVVPEPATLSLLGLGILGLLGFRKRKV